MDYLGFHLQSRVFLAPMAGISDRPYRRLCRQMGAGITPSEMVSSHAMLRDKVKTLRRADHQGEPSPRVVQIAGADPQWMAAAARVNVDRGAEIIDINMGCPAKKVCNTLAGSALLRDEPLVAKILQAVVDIVPEVPVTLKMRTGWDRQHRNAVSVARIAEGCGIRAIAIHGRTRCDMYLGEAEYDTIAEVKTHVRVPIIANGDITDGPKALAVLRHTQADAVMIGRGAQGDPWIFDNMSRYLNNLPPLPRPTPQQLYTVVRDHLLDIHQFYGADNGVRVARKHLGWYIKALPAAAAFRRNLGEYHTPEQQLSALEAYFADCALANNWDLAA